MRESRKRVFRFGRFCLDSDEGVLFRDSSPIALTPKTFQTLRLLVEHHGRTLERDELIRRIWPDTVVEEGNLSFHVHQARKALGGAAEEFIATVPRRGYRFVADVDEVAADESPAHVTEAMTDSVGQSATSRLTLPSRARLQVSLSAALAVALLITLAHHATRFVPVSEAGAPPAVPLTAASGWETDPAFSPDGKQLVYVWQDLAAAPQLYVRRVDTSEVHQVTSLPKADLEMPRWSADGKRLAFIRSSGHMVEILTVDASGGEGKVVAQPSGSGPVYGFDWSPDGKQLAFSRSPRSGVPSAIFMVDLDSGAQTAITNPSEAKPTLGDRHPAFSPDGRTLAFARYIDYRADLFLVPIRGGEPRRLTTDSAAILGLDWTANGSEIVFSSRRASSKGTLWRISASGGTPRAVSRSDADARELTVSGSGGLAFVDWIGDHNIWRVPVDGPIGGAPSFTRLVDWRSIDAAPDVSADGQRIAFMSNRSGNTEIWVCDREFKTCDQLTGFEGAHTGVPRWAPDGRWFAFASRPEGHDDIYIANVRRDVPRRITTESSAETAPSWSRDGHWIYFASDRTGQFEIWKAPVNGAAPVQVTRNGGFAAFESRDGRFLFYTKRKAPGLWQMPLSGGPEVLILRDDPAATLWGYWAVSDRGVYFVKNEGPSKWGVAFLDFATHQVRSIALLPKLPGPNGPGLTLTPDGREVLISLVDRSGSNIMLVANFR